MISTWKLSDFYIKCVFSLERMVILIVCVWFHERCRCFSARESSTNWQMNFQCFILGLVTPATATSVIHTERDAINSEHFCPENRFNRHEPKKKKTVWIRWREINLRLFLWEHRVSLFLANRKIHIWVWPHEAIAEFNANAIIRFDVSSMFKSFRLLW